MRPPAWAHHDEVTALGDSPKKSSNREEDTMTVCVRGTKSGESRRRRQPGDHEADLRAFHRRANGIRVITLSSHTVRVETAATPPASCDGATTPAADREAELRTLMTMAAHDLKNPLASVTAHVTMLREDYSELGADFQADLAAIDRGLHRMTRLTQELLDYARADRDLELIPVPLNDLISEI